LAAPPEQKESDRRVGGGGGTTYGTDPAARCWRPPGANTDRVGKDEPKPGRKQPSRLKLVVERDERREIWTVAVARGRIEPIPDREDEIRAAEELPHEGRAVAQIGGGVRRERMPPCLDEPRRAEDHVVGALEPPHHERAGLDVPIGVPANRVVAFADQQRRLIAAP